MKIKNFFYITIFLFYTGIISCTTQKNQNIMKMGNESNYKNVKFIKNKTFDKLKDTSINKDFIIDFQYIDLKDHTYYREKYLEILKREKIYINKDFEEKWGEEESGIRKELIYYFFDMNGDKIPELIVNNMPYSIDIFTFDIYSRRVKLIDSLNAGIEFLGDNYVYSFGGGVGVFENYFKLADDGEWHNEVIFYSGSYPNKNNKEEEDVLYTIGSRENSTLLNEIKNIAKMNNEIIYHNEVYGFYCFRITKEQSDELMKPYLEIRKKAKENMNIVTYTYNELFGEFEKSKKIISDITIWSHPTKNIFTTYKIKINKVELVDKYPIFYVNFGKVYSKIELDKFILELLKANGYWDFEIVEGYSNKTIKIYGDKKNKNLLKYEYK